MAQQGRQDIARLRETVALGHIGGGLVSQTQILTLGGLQAQPAVADGAADQHHVAQRGARAQHGGAGGDLAQHGGAEGQGPRRGRGVAAQQDQAIGVLIPAQAGGEGFAFGPSAVGWPGDCQEIGVGISALGGQIGQVHAQQLARHQVHGIFRQKVHAAHNHVRRDDQIGPVRPRQDGGVVQQAQGFGRAVGQGAQQTRDEIELVDPVPRGTRPAHRPLSDGRGQWRPGLR